MVRRPRAPVLTVTSLNLAVLMWGRVSKWEQISPQVSLTLLQNCAIEAYMLFCADVKGYGLEIEQTG